MTEEEKREMEIYLENAAREVALSEAKEALKWLEEFKKRHPRPKHKRSDTSKKNHKGEQK